MEETYNAIAGFISANTLLEIGQIRPLLQQPKDPSLGDIAFPCFTLSKTMRKSPQAIAEELASKFKASGALLQAKAIAGYLNFFVDKGARAGHVLETIERMRDSYGNGSGGKRFLLEFPSPNTNKPLHLGHVKLVIFGMALSNILRKAGNEAKVVNLLNDRGIHICKSMLAYMKWGKGETPTSSKTKGDYLVGKYYVLFAKAAEEDPKLEDEAQELLVRWEQGDADVRALWKTMNSWSKEGMDQTFEQLGFHPDKEYKESDIYLDGKRLVLDAYGRGMLVKDKDENIMIDLEEHKLGKKVLLRADGTTVYSTQDLALAFQKYKDFAFDRSLYLVGTEQNFYLQQIFKTIEALGYPWGKDCIHIRSGMISLPTGRMKSREGTVVEADELIEEMARIADAAIRERHAELSDDERESRARAIGLGAMRFFFLKYDSENDFVFNPQESIAFEGETGPYVQYAHARICSLLRKSGLSAPKTADCALLTHESELALIRVLDDYPSQIQKAARNCKPHIMVRSLLDIAQAFNNFYHACTVLKEEDAALKDARLYLCDCVRLVLHDGLCLLGIEPIEEM